MWRGYFCASGSAASAAFDTSEQQTRGINDIDFGRLRGRCVCFFGGAKDEENSST